MDYNDPSRRQYAQNPYTTQQQQQQQQQQHGGAQATGQYTTPGTVERFRQSSYIPQSPTTVPSSGRAGSDAQVYGFAAQSSQYATGASASAQGTDYPSHIMGVQSPDVPRQQDTAQQYQQYGSSVMYGMAGQAQTATQSPYDPVSRYTQQRPGIASETLASQFGGPQTAQYYLAGQSVPTSATMPDLAAPHLPSQYQSAYAQAGPSASQTYGAMMDPTQPGAYSAYAAAQYTPQSNQSIDQAFNNYQAQIRTLFTNVRAEQLRDVGQLLMDISHYLLGNAEALGLTRDDDNLHDDRIRLWDEFNNAWRAALQAQFDMTREWIRDNQPRREPRSVMNQQTLETLSRELVRLCDSIEKHGLVDYQMGVAEEEIMDLLLRCLAQLDPESAGSAEAGADSSASAAARSR
ncbi:hypothetical protein M409DRAFT_24571 [Zasmidium cellare ATCC 36951]|uniref:Uncharacterized protein n=1 Tax=Zasmidium cellare ATCC 36951 TaxID=1080233 RepID=A0A6A6CIG0_ZASCE|nr:uncharacterized protein M409DRAFT_24571 [Zasmidium cellare ATCC 36951]KAF2165186.1 hypothetical protein M409DRAFT_24571 [Zasmidium cellare ATCC 36951]